jgi:hypothetical protein
MVKFATMKREQNKKTTFLLPLELAPSYSNNISKILAFFSIFFFYFFYSIFYSLLLSFLLSTIIFTKKFYYLLEPLSSIIFLIIFYYIFYYLLLSFLFSSLLVSWHCLTSISLSLLPYVGAGVFHYTS